MVAHDSAIRLGGDEGWADIVPALGGRIARLVVGGRDLLLTAGEGGDSLSWGCYPMAPWAGRVRHGRFTVDGAEYQLPLSYPPHAIHGTVTATPWDVVSTEPGQVTMRTELGPDWPLGGEAMQRLALWSCGSSGELRCSLTVAAGERAMPVEVGWHPWFVKPDSLELRAEAMYHRDAEGIPDGSLVAVPAGPWDDCFVGVAPPRLHFGQCTVTITSDCDHWVVFDEPEQSTCVEPQSGPPDAFNLAQRVIGPSTYFERSMVIRWSSRTFPEK